LQKAITEAFDNPNIEERRPLVLYLHHDDSVAAHIFPQNVCIFLNIMFSHIIFKGFVLG